MRKIKFRGKTENNQWVEGDLIRIYNFDTSQEKEWKYAIKPLGKEIIEVIPETIGQFTGLTDKNGKEIFEGDIINITEEDEDSAMGREIRHIGVVKYGANGKYVSDYQTSFILHCKEWYKEEGLLYNIRYQYEITGNIHDNPELLNPTL